MFVRDAELDVELCVCSGQVFRWTQIRDGWAGVDGSNVITARRAKGGWTLESGPDPNAAARFFNLDKSLAHIARRVKRVQPDLAERIKRFPGLRVLRQERPDETLFSFLCTINNHLARITPMVRLLGRYGRRIEGDFHEFPSVRRIAAIPEDELRAKGFGYRGRVIPNVARQLMKRPKNWLESLRHVPYKDAHAALCEIDGVGPKVADCVCLIGLGHEEAVPVDTHLWQAACELYFPEWKGGSVTQRRYEAVGDRFRKQFGELAGWAHQYLFYERILDYRKGKPPVYS